jgi:Uma2 family endonuclease
MALLEAPFPTPARAHGRHVYVRPPKPIYFPSFEPLDEAVSETKRHLKTRTNLFLLLEDAFAGKAAIGSDQFVYWDPEDPRKCLSPDAFVKLDAKDEAFDNWKVWERSAPDLAVEIVSASDRPEAEWTEKLARYRASGIREVTRFDAENETRPIRVWDRIDGDLVERAPHDQDLRECAVLGLWWTLLPSDLGPMLRLARDRAGHDLLPTPDEERLRLAEELAEERKARALAEHERLLAQQDAREQAQGRELEARAREQAEQKNDLLLQKNDVLLQELEQLRAELARLRTK